MWTVGDYDQNSIEIPTPTRPATTTVYTCCVMVTWLWHMPECYLSSPNCAVSRRAVGIFHLAAGSSAEACAVIHIGHLPAFVRPQSVPGRLRR